MSQVFYLSKSWNNSSYLTSGSADDIINWLEEWKKRNVSKNAHLTGKTVQFVYNKVGSLVKETKTVKVEAVEYGFIKGYDLSLDFANGYRQYKEDRIVSNITVFN